MLGWILAAVVLAVALVECLVWTARLPSRAVVDGWAGRHGLALDEPATREDARHQLRRGRVARTLGFAVAFGIGVVSLYLTREPLHSPAWYGTHEPQSPLWASILASPGVWVAGYLVGALVGELTRRQPRPWRLRGAPLTPRHLGGYLPAGMLAAERCVALAVIALAPLAAHTDATVLAPSTPSRVGLVEGMVALAAALVVELGLRLVVHRAQPVASTGELAIDDAFRSTAVHRALAAGLAVQLFLLSEQAITAAFSLVPWLAPGIWLLGAGCFGLALRSWSGRDLPSRWQVRRPRTTVPPDRTSGR